ncbi:MAG: carbamoyltransferase HypF, partial [Desulfobacula sp.]|nr:carbamoyltransferase HypF [Desulfobacula sp.]
YIRMPGGDAAVLEPWRMAASILYQAFGKNFLSLDIPYIKEMEKEKLSFVCQMMEKNINSPLASSAGRLFDAIASLLCIRHKISHESQAAMELEAFAGKYRPANVPADDIYGFDILQNKTKDGDDLFIIDMMPCVRQIVEDKKQDKPVSSISSKFHHTLARAFSTAAIKVSKETNIKKIVLSGGVFNNDIILNQMIKLLEGNSLKVYTHTKVPTGDGGICLGQAMVAAAF